MFSGYWTREPDGPEVTEEGSGWCELDEALRWARSRSDRVLLQLGEDDGGLYSAGATRLTEFADGSGRPYPEWPPCRNA